MRRRRRSRDSAACARPPGRAALRGGPLRGQPEGVGIALQRGAMMFGRRHADLLEDGASKIARGARLCRGARARRQSTGERGQAPGHRAAGPRVRLARQPIDPLGERRRRVAAALGERDDRARAKEIRIVGDIAGALAGRPGACPQLLGVGQRALASGSRPAPASVSATASNALAAPDGWAASRNAAALRR